MPDPRGDVDLSFPVLCLSQDGSIAPTESADPLHRCNALAFFTNRYYDDMVVIDAQARHFRVVRADVVPALGAPSRWNPRRALRVFRWWDRAKRGHRRDRS